MGGEWDGPMRGWTKRPDIGPARKTIATAAFVRPRDKRYGVPFDVESVVRVGRRERR